MQFGLPTSPAGHLEPQCRLPHPSKEQSSSSHATIIDVTSSSERVNIVIGETLHIGRKAEAMPISSSSQAPCRVIRLPKAAKHASRHHCSVTLTESADEKGTIGLHLTLTVLGQNGMQLDQNKVSQGLHTVKILQDKEISLGFFSGFVVVVKTRSVLEQAKQAEQTANAPVFHASTVAPIEETTSILSYETASSSVSSSPLSSAPSSSVADNESPRPSKKRRRHSIAFMTSESPAPSPYAHQEDDGYPPESSDEEVEDVENDLNVNNAAGKLAGLKYTGRKSNLWNSALAALEASYLRVKEGIKQLDFDLISCISSSMVFQPRVTLTTSECTSLIMEVQPSLRTYGNEEAWRPTVLHALCTGPFGSIMNNGLKDASGKMLETSWHYSPSLDGDKMRRQSLEPFVKSVRSVCRQRAQYYFKPIQDLKRKRW